MHGSAKTVIPTVSTQTQNWIAEYFRLIGHHNADQTNLAQAHALKLQHLPKHLYRYRRPDGLAVAGLAAGTTWLSHPAKFNDPFDCGLSFSTSDLIRNWTSEQLEVIMERTGNTGKFTEAEIAEIKVDPDPLVRMTELSFIKLGQPVPTDMGEVLREMGKDRLDGALEELAARARESLRLCCLAETPNSTLMWSHYANEHRGFCLEYDLQTWTDPKLLHLLHPVHYSNKRYDATRSIDSSDGVNQLSPLAAACNKGIEWAYECEWRFVIPGGALNDNPQVRLPGLSRIILGARATPQFRELIQSIPRIKDVPIVQARLSKTDFAIEF